LVCGGQKAFYRKGRKERKARNCKNYLVGLARVGTIVETCISRKLILACPFFVPTERADDLALPHPARLPLGAAWRGRCAAPGHEQAIPDNKELEGCNLGYAKSCPRLPEKRTCDAVRFGVVKESGTLISLQVVFESQYRPAGHEFLEYDSRTGGPPVRLPRFAASLRAGPVPGGLEKDWSSAHSESSVQKQAECFLQTYLERRSR